MSIIVTTGQDNPVVDTCHQLPPAASQDGRGFLKLIAGEIETLEQAALEVRLPRLGDGSIERSLFPIFQDVVRIVGFRDRVIMYGELRQDLVQQILRQPLEL